MAHRGQFVDLGQHRLQPDLAGVGLQLRQQPPPCGVILGDQGLQRGHTRLGQPLDGTLAKPLLERRPGRTEDAVQPPGWLDPLGATPHQHRLSQPVLTQLDRADLVGQPPSQLVLVTAGELTEAERSPDLSTVIFNRAGTPRVTAELLGVHADLLGDVANRLWRNFFGIPRKPGLDLEELQQQGEPEPGRPGLVAYQPSVVTDQRPRFHQLIRSPLALHTRTLSSADHTQPGPPLLCGSGQLREHKAYKQTEPKLWTVGSCSLDGSFDPESDHGSPDEAAARVRYLNGGSPEPASSDRLGDFSDEEIAEALADADASEGEDTAGMWKNLTPRQREVAVNVVSRARTYLLGEPAGL